MMTAQKYTFCVTFFFKSPRDSWVTLTKQITKRLPSKRLRSSGSCDRGPSSPDAPVFLFFGRAAGVTALRLNVKTMENFKVFLVALCGVAAVGFVSIIFVLRWALYYKEGLAWDGGLAEFNWHPVLIVIGFIFLQGLGEWNKNYGGQTRCGRCTAKIEEIHHQIAQDVTTHEWAPVNFKWGRFL